MWPRVRVCKTTLMEHRVKAMKLAMRVITLVNEGCPTDSDLRELESLAGTKLADMSIEHYADRALRKALTDLQEIHLARENSPPSRERPPRLRGRASFRAAGCGELGGSCGEG